MDVQFPIADQLKQLIDVIVPPGRLAGLDLGDKTIGVAIADGGHSIASPLDTIKRRKFTLDAKALLTLLDGRQVGALVVGLPINMDGSEGPRCQSTRQFVRNLQHIRPLPALFWDERLSTAAVERVLISDADMTRKRRRQVVDKMAASFILQGALDHHRHCATPAGW
jgi:putative Holliday junction resolvase